MTALTVLLHDILNHTLITVEILMSHYIRSRNTIIPTAFEKTAWKQRENNLIFIYSFLSTWSDREVRTLLTRIYALPLSWGAVRFFEDIVINCTVLAQNQQQQQQHSLVDILTPAPAQPTILYERYQDSSIVSTNY